MKCCAVTFSILAGAVLLTGCGGGGSPPAAAIAENPATQAAPAPAAPAAAATPTPPRQPVAIPASAAPDQVVSLFLDSLRKGDEATTAHLLTAKAREETAKHGYAVAPESAPNASYKVAQAQILPENPNGAHVTSIWTETYQEQQPDGSLVDQAITYEIVWVLRNEAPSGWRIAGMAVEIVPGQDPEFMNFEDPLDMERKRTAAIAAQQPAGAPAGQGAPATPAGQGIPAAPQNAINQPGNAVGNPPQQIQAAQQPPTASSGSAPNQLR
jgi:hypothetical protein